MRLTFALSCSAAILKLRPMTPESKSRVVYENLDTTFVNIWALLRKLTQRGFIGRVHVELENYTADVFLTGSSTPLVHEVDRAAGTDTLEEAALHRLVLRVRETPGIISVFEGPDEAVAGHGTETLETKAAESESAQEGGLSQTKTDQAHDEDAGKELRTLGSASDQPIRTAEMKTPALSKSVMTADDRDAVTVSFPVEAEAQTKQPMDEIEWGAIVKAGGELIGGVERALTGTGADFVSYFDRVRLELADDYVFLDPMGGEFRYSNSVVTLSGEVPAGPYVIGLSEALRRVVESVATGDRARRVRERVALELFSVARKRREILDRSGFLAQLDRIAGTKVL